MKDYSGYIIVSDFDGTIFTRQTDIDAKSIEALRGFTAQGGRFTIATGRAVPSICKYTDRLPVNAPVIAGNGAVLYDVSEKKIVMTRAFSFDIRDYLSNLLSLFPSLSCEVFTPQKVLCVCYNDYTRDHLEIEKIPFSNTTLSELPETSFKVLLIGSVEEIKRLEEYTALNPRNGVYYVRTQVNFFEIMPAGVSKATALPILCSIMKTDRENTYTVGDYYNDMEMILWSPHGACVSSAPEEVKKCAEFVVPDCGEGSVAGVVKKIMYSN